MPPISIPKAMTGRMVPGIMNTGSAMTISNAAGKNRVQAALPICFWYNGKSSEKQPSNRKNRDHGRVRKTAMSSERAKT